MLLTQEGDRGLFAGAPMPLNEEARPGLEKQTLEDLFLMRQGGSN